MSASPVSICSNALLMLGDSPISSFDDSGDRVLKAANLWPSVRDFVLRSHPWNCAVKRIVLAPLVDAPPFDFAYAFPLPNDWLRTLSIGEEGERPRYRMEAGVILMDDNACRLRYIFRNENVASWDASLIWATTMVMRGVLAYGITQSTSLEQVISGILRPLLREARAVDGQEDDTEVIDDSPLMQARYIGSRGY